MKKLEYIVEASKIASKGSESEKRSKFKRERKADGGENRSLSVWEPLTQGFYYLKRLPYPVKIDAFLSTFPLLLSVNDHDCHSGQTLGGLLILFNTL